MTTRQWIVAGIMMTASFSQASQYSFKDLAMNDFADMEKLVRLTCGENVIDDSEREPKVREALTIVMSRKNSDGKRSALFSELQGKLPEAFFALSIHRVAESAIAEMKEPTSSNLRKATSYIVLENIMSEIQPRIADFKDTLELIKDAQIEISDSLKSYRRLEGMDANESPSITAENILKKGINNEAPQKSVAVINPDIME